MKLSRTEISYCLEMTNEEFTIIIDKDDKNGLSQCLYSLLEKVGCSRIEYDSHFGPNIFFTLPYGKSPFQVGAIEVIKDYINN